MGKRDAEMKGAGRDGGREWKTRKRMRREAVSEPLLIKRE